MDLRTALRFALVGVNYLHPAVLGVAVRRGPRAAVQYLKEMYHCSKSAAGLYLPFITVDEFIPQDTHFRVYRPADAAERYAWLTLVEMSILCCTVAARQPRKILEIGTYRGLTTLNLAMNAPDAIVHTLDETNKWGSSHYWDRPEASRIRQHFGDTQTFNFGQIGSGVEFCLIDAGHSYECVRNDTTKVIPLMSNDGYLLWHDYGRNDFLASDESFGTTQFLHEIAWAGVAILQHTSFGVLRVNPENRNLLQHQLGSV
jgi:hypothetical protein